MKGWPCAMVLKGGATSTTSFDGGTNPLIDSVSQEFLDAWWFDGIRED